MLSTIRFKEFSYKVEEWESYSDNQIEEMDRTKALDWWETWKDFILSAHKNLPEVHSKEK